MDEYIIFNAHEDFTALSPKGFLTFIIITDGGATLSINGHKTILAAPCFMLLSHYDTVKLIENHQLTAKTLSFHPTFINKDLTEKNLRNSAFNEISDQHDNSLIIPFIKQNEHYSGIIKPQPQIFLRIAESFDLANRAYSTASDSLQPHRIRRYLLDILLTISDIYPNGAGMASDKSIIDAALNYIHTHYSNTISLDSLCKAVYLNRTSLTRIFKKHTRRTPIDYILHHRLNVACELLTHSSLSNSKIAELAGFKYESYFSKQFTAKIGVTPTQYRQNEGFEMLNMKESRIVDEF